MGDRHDYVALDWVKGEIEEVLKQAQYELEAYVESPGDTARMKFCLTYLHQVRGTLQMVEFYGAAMLAEEMEAVAQALLNEQVADANEARQVLMQAILQLPNYLDHIKLGRRDLPVVLLPVLNDLRGARGEALLSETSLFQPSIEDRQPLSDAQQRQFSDKQFVDLLRKLRQMYQVALLGLLKGKDVEQNTQYLHKVAARLAKLFQKTQAQDLWFAASAVLEGLANNGVALNSAVKELLKKLEPELKKVVTQGPGTLNDRNDDLLKNLLFYVAKCEYSSPRIDQVKQDFNLKDALPTQDEVTAERNALKGPDKATMGSVATALIEEITTLKERLDLLVQDKEASSDQLALLVPAFKQITDTMGMLGLGTPRKVIQDQFDFINEFVASGQSASNVQLMDVAGALLYVEASLTGLSDRFGGEPATAEAQQLGEAQHVVLRESKQIIEKVKELVVDYAKGGELTLLAEAADQLMSLRGTLIMVPQVEAAEIARYCSNILHKHVDQNEQPSAALLDALAESLSGVEYFLERIDEDAQQDSNGILQRARDVILPFIAAQDLAADEPVVAEDALEDDLEEVSLEAPVDDAEQSIDRQEPVSSVDIEDEAIEDNEAELETITLDDVSAEEAEAGAIDFASIEQPEEWDVSAEDALSAALEEPVESEVLAVESEQVSVEQAAPVAMEEDDDDLIDDEIIEIFLEEAEEVLETIHEFWPAFKGDTSDEEALITTRRAFHTLKGSGRMVSASDIGETAWAIENMFNRLIDQTIQLSDELFTIVDYVIEQIPALIEAFKYRQACPLDVDAIQEYANKIAKGEAPGEWQGAAKKSEQDSQNPATTAESSAEIERHDEASEKEANDQNMDQALLNVFSSEVTTHLNVVAEFIENAQNEDYQVALSDELQRALHTLKGSAHMAHIEPIAEIAAGLENFTKDLRAYHIDPSAEIVHFYIRGKELLDQGYQQLDSTPYAEIPGSQDLLADLSRFIDQVRTDVAEDSGQKAKGQVDPQVLSIFLSEGMDIINEAEDIMDDWKAHPDNSELLLTLIDEMQTLEKGAQMSELPPVVALCQALQVAYQRIKDEALAADSQLAQTIIEAHEALLNMMDMVAASQAIVPAKQLIADLTGETLVESEEESAQSKTVNSEANEGPVTLDIPQVEVSEEIVQQDIDPELLEIFLEEAEELLDSITEALNEWKRDPSNLIKVAELQRDLHTFKGGARMAEINAIGDLAHELEDLYEGLSLGRLTATAQLFELLQLCHDRLADMVAALQDNQGMRPAPELITAIQLFIAGESLEVPSQANAIDETPHTEGTENGLEQTLEPAQETQSVSVESLAVDADEEVIEIFLEEADELLEELDGLLQQWKQSPENLSTNEAVQRVLHTLKGGARIAGLVDIGDMAHQMETELQKRLTEKRPADEELFTGLHEQYDFIAGRIEHVQEWFNAGASEPLMVPVENATDTADTAIETETVPTQVQTNVVPLRPQPDAEEQPAAASNVPAAPSAENTPVAPQASPQQPVSRTEQEAQGKRQGPQEMIKVPASLLDGLVNLAGETSISRGRLETQVTDFSYTLDEMDSTLDRLRDQLRRLDMETEAQVLFRREQQGPEYEDFDPLEMDRYSQLQQLSRSLVESASDLADLKSTLLDKTRDAETLLLQQSRVNTELQEGLMKTRMVPFSRLVPRLRRIVRQISTELGKQVELHVSNAEGEMDRSVLERLISPLEHMLRNAVDHGLESTEKRKAAGKPETGNIYLSLSRDGGDVVLRLADDGAGINVDAVRRKAIDRGLLDPSVKMPDQEIYQFILQAGFSTAEQITQISGRGVGMDVVNSEIKQVGGTVVINSQQNQGTEFVIRLPFTVSVNRALMAKVGEALFAIPLNNIEGIVRVSANNLRELLKQDKPTYHYAGREYQLEYLGRLLRDENMTRLPEDNTPMPVVLVRGSSPAAIQVDTLMGSREIVVKTLGPQFNSVVGVSGGTILGDGSVVIILDLPNMMRHVNTLEYQQHMAIEHEQEAELEAVEQARQSDVTSILVVDDSVTVRKVTTRLLERNGMEVRTAKDGVDAMATLQEYKPDLVLLDIEMPRMDGFEVASQMRHSQSLKQIPIIMITSRTGEKHKERAMAIGVTDYMGKPFQEERLLEAIAEYTGHRG